MSSLRPLLPQTHPYTRQTNQNVTLKMLPTVRWVLIAALIALTAAQDNPSILEDSRVHPTVDGSFGFLYRTQDGIAHAAKGDPGGAVHGRFTYTDPTGLKVNFNYNAGAQAIKQKQAEQYQPQPQYQPAPQPQYRPPPPSQSQSQDQDQGRYTQVQYEQDYEQPAYEQQPRYRPAPAPAPRNYAPPPQQYRPRPVQRNDIYDNDYNDPRYNRP